MKESEQAREATYHYPPLYRGVALFSVLLFGLILLGTVAAGVGAIRNGRADVILHIVGFIIGVAMVGWGLDFATRSITVTSEGLRVRWLLRRSLVPWPEVLGWRYLPLSLVHLRFQHGRGLYLWPLLEDYLGLLSELDAHRVGRMTK